MIPYQNMDTVITVQSLDDVNLVSRRNHPEPNGSTSLCNVESKYLRFLCER